MDVTNNDHDSVDTREAVAELLSVVARLRGPDGCPWDRRQTLLSLRPCLVEECYELLDAIDNGDADSHCEELGDVLLQVILQAQIRSESKAFGFKEVVQHLTRKLVRRHPHVFGDVSLDSAEEVVQQWDAIKREEKRADGSEKEEAGTLGDLPMHLPALLRAQRLQERAARVGFDWDNVEDVFSKIEEEIAELREALTAGNREQVDEECGDLLFSIVNFCRARGLQAEDTLRAANRKFTRRFKAMEHGLRQQGKKLSECSLATLDQEWNRIKAEEKS